MQKMINKFNRQLTWVRIQKEQRFGLFGSSVASYGDTNGPQVGIVRSRGCAIISLSENFSFGDFRILENYG